MEMQACWRQLFSLVERMHSLSAVEPELAGQLTLAQARVARVIFSHAPETVMIKDIAEELRLTPSAVSQTVEWLVRENIVERCQSLTDRRAVAIRPAPLGEAFRQEHDRRISTLMQRLSTEVAPEEAEVFLKVLVGLGEKADEEWRSGKRGEILSA